MDTKHALLLSPYFTPSNLAGVQRVRVMASRLQDFGWTPTVLTVDADQYEEANDASSLALLPDGLAVERVRALPKGLCRLMGLGDVSLRAQWSTRRRVSELARRGEADLVFATVLPGYTSLVGAWAKRKLRLPFVLDYQDPWVSDWGAKQPRLSKAGITHWLAMKLEPRAVTLADALTAVSDETLSTLRERRLLRDQLPVEIIPIGADANDHVVAARAGRSWIRRKEDEFVMAYLGTIAERMLPCVRAFFRAVRQVVNAKQAKRPVVYFIGTSAQQDGKDAHGLESIARECGVADLFRLEPRRVGYLDALRTMQDADALLLFGSTDSHYTASKIFPCWLARKPVFALFHAASTVNDLARELGGVRVVTYDSQAGAETRVDETARVLSELVQPGADAVPQRNEAAYESYSARGVARRYAALFDRVTAKQP